MIIFNRLDEQAFIGSPEPGTMPDVPGILKKKQAGFPAGRALHDP
jgi:hypothetical protein